jgi:hypothetical protein
VGGKSSEFLRTEGDVPARRPLCEVVGWDVEIPSKTDLVFLQRAIDLAFAEAIERHIQLTVPQITSRLFSAFDRGVRDEDELKNAIVFNLPAVHLH